MIAVYPRAVSWDTTKSHHQTVLVDRPAKVVTVWCYECERGYELRLSDIGYIRRCIAGDDDVQVVAWVDKYE